MAPAQQPFCRHITNYAGLVETVRDRLEHMRLSQRELDSLAGLADGHIGKIVSSKPSRNFGILSLGNVLQTLGLVLLAVEDPAARDRTLARRTPFDATNRRLGNHNCATGSKRKKIQALEQPGPPAPVAAEVPKPRSNEPVSRAHLRVIQSKSKPKFQTA